MSDYYRTKLEMIRTPMTLLIVIGKTIDLRESYWKITNKCENHWNKYAIEHKKVSTLESKYDYTLDFTYEVWNINQWLNISITWIN